MAACACPGPDLRRPAAPDRVRIDGAALTQLTQDIRAGQYANVHSVLVVRYGWLAYEEYFRGADEKRGVMR
jgi:hypothetical protein